MNTEKKLDTFIQIRVYESQKKEWLELCEKRGTSLTDLIISSVENKLLAHDRREIMDFIEKQGNIYAKIENNINQIARIVNTEKRMSENLMEHYNSKLIELNALKIQELNIFRKIYKFLASM